MNDRDRQKAIKGIFEKLEKLLVKMDDWYTRRGGVLSGFDVKKDGRSKPTKWLLIDANAPKGWDMKVHVDEYDGVFRIRVDCYYVKFGKAGANFYTTKIINVAPPTISLQDREGYYREYNPPYKELRDFILRRRRRVRHTAKKAEGGNEQNYSR